MAEWRERQIPGFTRSEKAGSWCRSYKGRTVSCGGKRATREEVEKTYQRKCAAIDAGEALTPAVRPYRDVLSEFLAAQDCRVGAKRNALSTRMLHNYTRQLNHFGRFIGGGTPIDRIGPRDFSNYAAEFRGHGCASFDSVVTRTLALFNWAKEMGYIDGYRTGPEFVRPSKQDIREARIARTRAFAADEVARLYAAGSPVWRCMVGLGVCCAFNNSDVANLTRDAVDLDAGVVDFRRRKTGKVRRVCPLPAELVEELRAYVRPEPRDAAFAPLMFLTRQGHPYSRSRKGDGKPCDAISRLFPKLIDAAGVPRVWGRNFAGLRTTFPNLAPPGYREEVEIIMGHAHGTTLLDHYMEGVGMERLKHVVDHVWSFIMPGPWPRGAT